MRITVTLDDEVHSKLMGRAKEEDRSIANMAGRLIEFGLERDEPVAADLPRVLVPEPTPSKPLTPRAPASTTRQTTGEPCPHPKAKQRQINGGAVVCDACGARLR